MNLKRTLYRKLSKGRGIQLLGLIGFALFCYLLFWGISAVFYQNEFRWKDIVSLFLDPGVFGESGPHEGFRLVVTLFGVFLVAALLTSVIFSVFENMAESYRNGNVRYCFKNHVLILGANHMLLDMLNILKDPKNEYEDYRDRQIVIMTTQPVGQLRARIEAYFGKDKFLNRITYYYDERDEERNLKEANADKAYAIFVIGEDSEDNHDAINLKCLKGLKSVCSNAGSFIHCHIVMDEPTTMRIFHYATGSEQEDKNQKLLIDIVNSLEYEAERVLTSEAIPRIDREGIKPNSNEYVHLIIFGMTPTGQAFATAAANLMHYPNWREGNNSSVITFIGENIWETVNEFKSRFTNMFDLSYSKYMRLDRNGKTFETISEPDLQTYDDILDIKWQFIDSSPFNPTLHTLLCNWANDERQLLSLAICQGSSTRNTDIALNLPKAIYCKDKNIPIFVHIDDYDEAIEKAAATGQFGNVCQFGAASSSIFLDPLFKNRTEKGMRVNWIWAKKFGKKTGDAQSAWYAEIETKKLSSIYSAVYASAVLKKYSDEGIITDEEGLCRLEHRRWFMSQFLRGYQAPTKAEILKMCENSEEKKNYKDKKFIHHDMVSYDKLPEEEKNKDRALIINLNYIMKLGHLQLD